MPKVGAGAMLAPFLLAGSRSYPGKSHTDARRGTIISQNSQKGNVPVLDLSGWRCYSEVESQGENRKE